MTIFNKPQRGIPLSPRVNREFITAEASGEEATVLSPGEHASVSAAPFIFEDVVQTLMGGFGSDVILNRARDRSGALLLIRPSA